MSALNFEKTQLDGVLKISASTIFEDFRGIYVEIFNENLFKNANINTRFIQDDVSTSRKYVLRGIHGDNSTWKLVTCLLGTIYLVVVNNDDLSAEYRKWQSFTLSDKNQISVLIPPKFGNGHLVMSDTAIFHYKQSTDYKMESQFTIKWNDPTFNIWWPISQPILSQRDK